MRTKVAYIISHVDKALAFEWVATYLNQEKVELTFILLNDKESHLEDFLNSEGIKVFRVNYPNKYSLVPAFFKIRGILLKNRISLVHTHLFDACLVGLMAARSVGIKRRLHTRHNATIHHHYFPNAVKYDRFINYLSTEIIAISEVVRKVLIEMEGVEPSKIRLIHHGFDFSVIPKKESTRVEGLRIKYKSEGRHPVIGAISRYIEWKGVGYIIKAFKDILIDYPNALLLLGNAIGPQSKEIRQQLMDLPRESYMEIEFEPDVFAFYKLFDVFVHTPIDSMSEAFGQVYVEALASEIPSVFTVSGIAHDLIINRKNALVVDYENSNAIRGAIMDILSDSLLQERIVLRGKEDVMRNFGIERMVAELESIYE
jgi:glycosyltransferase involved in cell wall biosynthesis